MHRVAACNSCQCLGPFNPPHARLISVRHTPAHVPAVTPTYPPPHTSRDKPYVDMLTPVWLMPDSVQHTEIAAGGSCRMGPFRYKSAAYKYGAKDRRIFQLAVSAPLVCSSSSSLQHVSVECKIVLHLSSLCQLLDLLKSAPLVYNMQEWRNKSNFSLLEESQSSDGPAPGLLECQLECPLNPLREMEGTP
eukprot:scaffold66520_cov24-Tisochrysis_lutea.AAC.1